MIWKARIDRDRASASECPRKLSRVRAAARDATLRGNSKQATRELEVALKLQRRHPRSPTAVLFLDETIAWHKAARRCARVESVRPSHRRASDDRTSLRAIASGCRRSGAVAPERSGLRWAPRAASPVDSNVQRAIELQEESDRALRRSLGAAAGPRSRARGCLSCVADRWGLDAPATLRDLAMPTRDASSPIRQQPSEPRLGPREGQILTADPPGVAQPIEMRQ